MLVVGGMAPMTLETLHSMSLVHRVMTVQGIEYYLTLPEDQLATDVAAPTSTSSPETPLATSSPPHSLPPSATFGLIFYSSAEFQWLQQ